MTQKEKILSAFAKHDKRPEDTISLKELTEILTMPTRSSTPALTPEQVKAEVALGTWRVAPRSFSWPDENWGAHEVRVVRFWGRLPGGARGGDAGGAPGTRRRRVVICLTDARGPGRTAGGRRGRPQRT